MPKGKARRGWSRYDAALDLIETDVTGVRADDIGVIDDIFDELEEVARRHPGRYVLACWKETEITDQRVAAHYGVRTTRLLSLVGAVVRYAANDAITRAMVRTQAIRHMRGGMRSNLYETREEALAAIEELRRIDAEP